MHSVVLLDNITPRREITMAEATGKRFAIPARMSEVWLQENAPKLTQAQARDVIAALTAKGWTYSKGSLQDRVYARLTPKVREKMEAERKASTAQ
jgi:hypothetical protein